MQVILRAFIFCISTFFAFESFAYQKLSGLLTHNGQFIESQALTMNKNFRSFTFYVSDQYADTFSQGSLREITELHILGAKRALQILQDRGGVEGLEFTYGGLFKSDARFLEQARARSGDFEKKIFFDFTGQNFEGEESNFILGYGNAVKSENSGEFGGGIIVHINSKLRNLLHARESLVTVLLHEVLHGFGLGHSTNAASLMSYRFVTPYTISYDDILGLKQIYGNENELSKVKVESFFEGQPAAGVEVLYIDKVSGRSYTTLTDPLGKSETLGIPDGDYLVVGREFSEASSGPCFVGAQHGFKTSFYISDEATSNSPTQAASVSVRAGQTTELKLKLNAGVRRYDCYTGSSTRQVGARAGNMFNDVDVWAQYFRPGVYSDFVMETDQYFTLNGLESKVRTQPSPGIYDNIKVTTFGSAPAIELTNFHEPQTTGVFYMGAVIHPEAPLGPYSLLCESDGEFAVANAVIEVSEHGGSASNSEMFPELARMFDYDAKFAGDPAVEKKEDKGLCGVIAGASHSGASLLLLAPLLAAPLFRKRKREC